MNNMWWALHREQELRDTVTSKDQFKAKLEAVLAENENDADKLKSKIREIIKQY